MCDCPADWVVCFKRDCERGVNIKEAARQNWERARKMMGDPCKGVSSDDANK